MAQQMEFDAQWNAIWKWDWDRIQRAIAKEGIAYIEPALRQRRSSGHAAEAAPEDVAPGVPAELSPEDLRREVKQDVADASVDPSAPLSPQAVERELYFAAALHAHCQQRGLAMTAGRDAQGDVWICIKRLAA
jgi:hypothetical protein